jgi:peptidoglycan hydrolase-like protein with peptidoglycan-binding domain
MTHALSASTWDESAHSRNPAGGSGGGEFAGQSKTSSQKPQPRAQTRHHVVIPKGRLGFDGTRGTGYGMPHGDARVKRLQEALNRLGLTDSRGRKLAVDGKLGPLTTQSIKAAQERLGMKPTGIITEAFINRLDATDALPKTAHKPVKAATSDAPYGPKSQVEYADPGYQSDGKARYPLDSEEHCRAAWSYINQTDNAAKYTPDQLARIKAGIKAAGKKYGIDFADKMSAAAESPVLRGVELARPGDWKLSTGPVTFTDQMLRDAADFFAASGGQAVPVKLGHVDDRFDGEPTFGSLTNIRYAEDDRGAVLLGDIVDMPGWLSAAAPKRWPNRSIEGWQNFTYDGREYSLVLSGLAFLGVTPPAVRNIRSLADLQSALAASSALRLVASAPADDQAVSPQTAALVAEEPTKEGTGMDPVKIREALGLDPDASDDEVKSALITAAGVTPQSTPPPEPVQASLFDPPTPAVPAKPDVIAPGTMRVDASAWQAAQDRIKKLEAAADRQRVAERDQIIAKAVQDGKFAPARKEHWVRLWDADPEGARQAIDGLARNVIPVAASGYAGSDGDGVEDEFYSALYGKTKVG